MLGAIARSDGGRDEHVRHCPAREVGIELHGDPLAEDARPLRAWLARFFGREVRDAHEVDDLVQDVFTRIVAKSGGEPVGNLAAYVRRTAASVLFDRARRRRARHADRHVEFVAEVHAGEDFDPERVLSAREDLRAATAALLSLPERTRTIFMLRRLEGFAYREIAQRLGISVSAVEKHMVRAVRHLSTQMDPPNGS